MILREYVWAKVNTNLLDATSECWMDKSEKQETKFKMWLVCSGESKKGERVDTAWLVEFKNVRSEGADKNTQLTFPYDPSNLG